MKNHGPTMVAVTNSNSARLLQLSLTERNGCHVEEVASLTHTDQAYEHSRPSPRKGMTGDPGDDHETEEERRRFAREVVNWLNHRGDIDGRLVIFAPPRFRGALRKCEWQQIRNHVEIQDGDLTNVPTSELARHPLVRAVMTAA